MRLLFPLLFIACTATSDTEAVDTGPIEDPVPVCDTVADVTLATRVVADASLHCDGTGCVLSLPDSEPTRGYARLRYAGDQLALDAWEFPEVLYASDAGVFAITEPNLQAFEVGGGRLWLARTDDILGIDTSGAVVERCAVPEGMTALLALGFVADRLVVNGLDADRTYIEVQATGDGWLPFETEVAAWRYRDYAPGEVLLLGYGYAEWRDVNTDDSVLIGGSDDDFSRAAVCADGTYWVGGMTGILMHCSALHACEHVQTDAYPFQSEAYGCDAEGALWWLQAPERGRLTPDGAVSVSAMQDGLRTGTEQYGRQWTVVDASSTD